MSLLDNFRYKVTDAVGTAHKASNEFIEVSRINYAIKTQEEKIRDTKLEIGRMIYESYALEKPVDSVLEIKCEEIADCERVIGILKQKALEVKNLARCSSCLATIDKDTPYCPKCGGRIAFEKRVN